LQRAIGDALETVQIEFLRRVWFGCFHGPTVGAAIPMVHPPHRHAALHEGTSAFHRSTGFQTGATLLEGGDERRRGVMREVAERGNVAIELLEAARALESTRAVAALLSAAVAGIAQLARRARPHRPPLVTMRLVPADAHGVLMRSGSLTPYDLETLLDDAR